MNPRKIYNSLNTASEDTLFKTRQISISLSGGEFKSCKERNWFDIFVRDYLGKSRRRHHELSEKLVKVRCTATGMKFGW